MDPSSIIFRETGDADWDAVNALFTRVFGGTRDPAYWTWMIKESPDALGVSVVAVDASSEVVGHAASISRGFHVGGVRSICGQSVDAMTHPDWQRQGINRALNELLVQRNVAASIPYLMGFSNENSTHTVLEHQGRKVVGKFPVLVRPLTVVRGMMHWARSSADSPTPRTAEIPEDVEGLWMSRGDGTRVGVARDHSYLQWRYRRPGGAYVPVELREGGELKGIGVLGLRIQARLMTAFVMDAFVQNDDRRLWKRLVRAMTRAARSLRCDAICALAFPRSPDRRAYTRAGFLPVPEKLNPEQIVFSLRTTGPDQGADDAWDPAAWRLSWGDTDLV
jgi:GNAT superfamily N-acetyltransferase